MKPIIKWVGGKTRFLKYINQEIDKINFNNYFEPFFGSGAVFFSMFPNEQRKKYFINDHNKNLMDFYEWIKDGNPEQIHDSLHSYFGKFELMSEEQKREAYNKARNDYNNYLLLGDEKDNDIKSFLFFVLNKTSFNGIYRVNGNGQYNVPVGRHNTYKYPSLEEVKSAQETLKKCLITHGDWWEILKNVMENDLVYLDPPYYPDASSNFIGYTDPLFGITQHDDLINRVEDIVLNKGASVIISNSASEEFRQKLEKKFKNKKKISYSWQKIQTNRSVNPLSEEKERFVETLYIIRRK